MALYICPRMTEFQVFIDKIKDNLRAGKPGLDSQLKMAPLTRREELKVMSGSKPRESAVLVVFYPVDGKTHLVLMKRAKDESVHSAQISFPGGKKEYSDTNLEATALRESWEEIGLNPSEVTVIGQLSKLYIPPSNFDVFPFVGYCSERPHFVSNHEVEKLLEVPLSELHNPMNRKEVQIHHRSGKTFEVPAYGILGETIWGATAMMISELLDIID